VISKSDLVILVVASGALAVGISRWYQNTQDVSAVTIPASATSNVLVEPAQNSDLAVFKTVESVDTPTNTSIQTDSEGQVVVKTVPQPEPVVDIVVGTDTTAETTSAPTLGLHTVQSGDYLGKIADQYGTDVQTLRELNNISGTIIQIGQEIFYPL